jgi:hypothetical protein
MRLLRTSLAQIERERDDLKHELLQVSLNSYVGPQDNHTISRLKLHIHNLETEVAKVYALNGVLSR